MTAFVQRLTLVLALASFATPALSEIVRRPASVAPASSYRARPGRLSSDELSASAGGGPADASPQSRAAATAERLAAARKAIDQVLGTLPMARKPG